MDSAFLRDAFRTLTWIGIIEQLQRTRAERLLRPLGLSYPEFAMLNHFSHGHPPAKTVTGIAADMQQLQPAVTKTVAKLVARGFVKAAPSAADGRSKILTLTAKGRAGFVRAVGVLEPAIAEAFDGWTADGLKDFFVLLDRLKTVLDMNR